MRGSITDYKVIPILAYLKGFLCENFKGKLKYFTRQISFTLLTVHRNTVDESFLGHSGVFRYAICICSICSFFENENIFLYNRGLSLCLLIFVIKMGC